jgi:tetratricopeptide (TPR) repeat protein
VRPRPGCVALLAAAAVAAACQRQAGSAAGGGSAGSGSARANAAYDEGVSWATKAQTAPLPTPPPLLSPLPKGAEPPPAPEFKPEEIQAVSSFERAIAAQPDDPRPQLALAELLAPHAVHRLEVEEQAAWKKKPVKTARGKPTPPPPPTPDPGGVDYSVGRIVRAYEAAIQNDPSARPVEALVAFAVQAKDLEAAEGALQELVKRVKESPEPFLRYGDFLLTVKKDADAAIEQYRQALIWRPDDEATKAKVAGIYIDMGSEAYARKQYAIAQSRFSDAAKYVTDKGSPQGLRLADYQARLREIRGR